jgi:hypothetical protein
MKCSRIGPERLVVPPTIRVWFLFIKKEVFPLDILEKEG